MKDRKFFFAVFWAILVDYLDWSERLVTVVQPENKPDPNRVDEVNGGDAAAARMARDEMNHAADVVTLVAAVVVRSPTEHMDCNKDRAVVVVGRNQEQSVLLYTGRKRSLRNRMGRRMEEELLPVTLVVDRLLSAVA